MPKSLSPTALSARILKLVAERKHHLEALVRIEPVLEQIREALGIGAAVAEAPSVTAPVQAAARPARKLKKYETTGTESILAFVRREGSATRAEIIRHWDSEGRGGTINRPLWQLLQNRKLKRTKLPGESASQYSVTGAARGNSAAAVTAKPMAAARQKMSGVTGAQLVLDFVRQKGNATLADLKVFWAKQGRARAVRSELHRLVKQGKLKRTELAGQIGGRYSLT